MGLDMWLYKRKKAIEEVAYWRKANQIRGYFEDILDADYYGSVSGVVSKDNLEELIDLCKEVIENPEKASELLPTTEGFYFGDTDYDEYYFEDLKGTIEMLEKVVEKTDWENEEVYYEEWW